MEKLYLLNNEHKRLVGNYVNQGSDTIVLLAHGFLNDKSSNGRFDQLLDFLCSKGIDALAIDFTGSGESEHGPINANLQAADLKVVIEFAEKKYKHIFLLGNSFGTLACLRNYRQSIRGMMLLGAITDAMFYEWTDFFSEHDLLQLDEKGFFHMNNERKHWITKETLKAFEEVDQEEMMGHIKCPILFVYGNHSDDKEELELLGNAKRAMTYLCEESRLEIIQGAKHGYRNDWNTVIEILWFWLKNFL